MSDQVKELSIVAAHQPSVPTTDTINSIVRLAQMACKSGMSKARNEFDAFFIAMYGLELGIPPMTAMRTIYSVQGGAPTCSGEAMLALIRRSGKVKVTISSTEETLKNKRATVHMKRLDSGDEFTATWGEEDDRRAQLRSNRDKYPAQMWTWRAVSICAKACASDIIGGLYTVEEIYPDTALNADGEPVDDIVIGTVTPVQPKPTPQPPPPAQPEQKTARKPLPEWVVASNVKTLLDGIRSRIAGVTDAEIALFAGIDSVDDLDGWGRYESGKRALESVMAGFEASMDANMKPATPKNSAPQVPPFEWDAAAIEAMETWLSENFWDDIIDIPMMSGPMLNMLEKPDWTTFSTPDAAKAAVKTRAVAGMVSIIATRVIYMKSKFSVFINAADQQRIEIERYGLREWLSEQFPDWKPAMEGWEKGKTYDLPAPLVVKWELKSNHATATSVALTQKEDIPF